MSNVPSGLPLTLEEDLLGRFTLRLPLSMVIEDTRDRWKIAPADVFEAIKKMDAWEVFVHRGGPYLSLQCMTLEEVMSNDELLTEPTDMTLSRLIEIERERRIGRGVGQ